MGDITVWFVLGGAFIAIRVITSIARRGPGSRRGRRQDWNWRAGDSGNPTGGDAGGHHSGHSGCGGAGGHSGCGGGSSCGGGGCGGGGCGGGGS